MTRVTGRIWERALKRARWEAFELGAPPRRTSAAARLVGGQCTDHLIDPVGRYPEQPQIGLAEFENEINRARHRRGAQQMTLMSSAVGMGRHSCLNIR